MMSERILLICVVALCAPASNDAFAPAVGSLPAAGGLRRTSCRGTTAVSMGQAAAAQLSRRAAVLGALLPAFADAAHAKGDGTLSFRTQISGSDGNGVDISFVYPTSWKLEEKPGAILVSEATLKACSEDPDACEVGEIIARSIATGDNALVIATEREAELEALPFSFFKKAIYSRGGKFGAYGAPEDVKTVSDTTANGVRTLDVKWNTFTPGGSTLAKRSIVTAVASADDIFMLVCSTSGKAWKSNEPTLRAVAASWKAAPTGKPVTASKIEGVKASMFKKENEERQRAQKEREDEGIY